MKLFLLWFFAFLFLAILVLVWTVELPEQVSRHLSWPSIGFIAMLVGLVFIGDSSAANEKKMLETLKKQSQSNDA